MPSKLYYKKGNPSWYKYYCNKCKQWFYYTTAWNLANNNMCKHKYLLPATDQHGWQYEDYKWHCIGILEEEE